MRRSKTKTAFLAFATLLILSSCMFGWLRWRTSLQKPDTPGEIEHAAQEPVISLPPRRVYQGDPASELVEALCSSNLEPVMHVRYDNSHNCRIPVNYSFAEQNRVRACAFELLAMEEQAFPALIARLNDNRYSWSFAFDFNDYNLTVGQMCRRLLENAINSPIRQRVRFYGPKAYHDTLNYVANEIAPDKAEHWMDQHRDQSLAQIQIEALEWALIRCRDAPLLPYKQFAADVESLQQEVSRLKKTGSPKPPKLYIGHCSDGHRHE